MELPVKRVITYTSVYRAAQTELNMEKKKKNYKQGIREHKEKHNLEDQEKTLQRNDFAYDS